LRGFLLSKKRALRASATPLLVLVLVLFVAPVAAADVVQWTPSVISEDVYPGHTSVMSATFISQIGADNISLQIWPSERYASNLACEPTCSCIERA